MPTIVISGPADAFADSPRDTDPITDRETLARFHGLVSEQACADTFDEPSLSELGVSGGRLRFVLDEGGEHLRITTAYRAPRPLTKEEIESLVDATKAQWSDGIGSGAFANHGGIVLSTALAMAMLNREPSRGDIGQYFVDAYPMSAGNDETKIEWMEIDAPEKAGLDYLKEAAVFGDAMAMLQLGIQHQQGGEVDQDHIQAFEWFTRAANAGVPLAMGCVGEAYENGNGVPKDLAKAAEWYGRGADRGDAPCQAQLGECFEQGKGVEVDLREALRWYELALQNGLDAVQPAIDRVRAAMR